MTITISDRLYSIQLQLFRTLEAKVTTNDDDYSITWAIMVFKSSLFGL